MAKSAISNHAASCSKKMTSSPLSGPFVGAFAGVLELGGLGPNLDMGAPMFRNDDEIPETLREPSIPAPPPERRQPNRGLAVRTGIRAGDMYMQNPPGSNDRNRDRHR